MINIQHCRCEILPIRCKRLFNQSVYQSIYHIIIAIVIRVSYASVLFFSSMMGLLICIYELFGIKSKCIVCVTQARKDAGKPPLFFWVWGCHLFYYFVSPPLFFKIKAAFTLPIVCLFGLCSVPFYHDKRTSTHIEHLKHCSKTTSSFGLCVNWLTCIRIR